MNKAMLTVGIILLSIIALGVINVIQNYTTGQELDYYLLKETTEAAMEDAVDLSYYREQSVIRMDKEKFAESFIKRFARSVDDRRSYEISFYDVNEVPPKASVEVKSATSKTFYSGAVDITTKLDMIVESNNKKDPLAAKLVTNVKAN
ncbi:MAG: hypothetical protein HFJ12_01690 [Bacilli bacterium]|nr:hypothetical protein [Bacilli bacterium]